MENWTPDGMPDWGISRSPMLITPDDSVKQAYIDNLHADTHLLSTNSKIAELNLLEAQRQETVNKQAAIFNNLVIMDGPIYRETTIAWMGNLRYIHESNPGCDINIYLTTPGGEIIHGLALYDYLNWLREQGHEITITVLGSAFSMGSIILQAAGRRIIGREAWLMLHSQQLGGGGGTLGEQMDLTDYLKESFERVLDIYAQRASFSTGEDVAVVRDAIKTQIGTGRRNWFLSSSESLKYGLVDEVL